MKSDTFSAGSTINTAYYGNSMCTGATNGSFVSTTGVCYLNRSGTYRFMRRSVSAPKTSFPVSSPVSAPTTSGRLTGYFFLAKYLDSACATVGYTAGYPLNACLLYFSDGKVSHAVLTATSTAYVFQQFSDSTCTIAMGTAVPTPYTVAKCSSANEIFFVQSSMSPPISKTTATTR
jgi:hypothetical protein